MKNVMDLPFERAWKNSPVIKLVLNDTRYMAMFDSGAMIPMYFGDKETLEDELGGRVLAENEIINGIGRNGMQLQFLLSYTMFRGCRTTLDDISGRFIVDLEQERDMYVRTPFIQRRDGSIFNLYATDDRI